VFPLKDWTVTVIHDKINKLQNNRKLRTDAQLLRLSEAGVNYKQLKIFKPEPAPVGPPSEPPIISESFFFLTSSSFSNDFSKGLMPTNLQREKKEVRIIAANIRKLKSSNNFK